MCGIAGLVSDAPFALRAQAALGALAHRGPDAAASQALRIGAAHAWLGHTRLSILEFLYQSLGERYRPNNLMVQYVKAGRLGRKAGKGVYEYEQGA